MAHVAREARCGVCDSVWKFLDFWIGLGVLSAFVAREARRGFGFAVCGGKWTPALALAPNGADLHQSQRVNLSRGKASA